METETAQTPASSSTFIKPIARRGAIGKLTRTFGYAIAGTAYLFRTQRNARVEAVMGILACGFGIWLHISRMEWALLTLCIASVLILEGVNTAIEATVDLACPERHPLAKTAKDVAAAMVLLASIASVVIGCLLFVPPIWAKVFGR